MLSSSDSNVEGGGRDVQESGGRGYNGEKMRGREAVRRSIGRKIFEIPGEPRDDSISQRPLNGPL